MLVGEFIISKHCYCCYSEAVIGVFKMSKSTVSGQFTDKLINWIVAYSARSIPSTLSVSRKGLEFRFLAQVSD